MKEIPLTNGGAAIVDDEDYAELSKHQWNFHGAGYAWRSQSQDGKKCALLMHRVVSNTPKGMETDHINGNKLDNRRGNLRVCTRAQNAKNRNKRVSAASKYKGVSRDKNTFRAEIRVDGRRIHVGRFKNERDAAIAYNKAAKQYHGEFARLNVIE